MSAIFTAFGIDWRLLVINMVNFGLLLAALWYFLYTPLLRIIDARKEKVAAGVRDAEAAAERLEQINESRASILGEAGKEADEVLARAREAAEAKRHEIVMAGEASAARILSDAELQAADEKERVLEESKKEVAKLVVLGLEKVLINK